MPIVEYIGGGRFRLATETGSQVIDSILVVDETSQSPVWWLVSENVPADHDPADLQVAVDLTESLKKARREGDRAAVEQELGDLRYGEVPPGFRQAHPKRGKPTPLRPGRKYVIHVAATLSEALSFLP